MQNLQKILIGLTSHLGDSGMKNKPMVCNVHGTAPANEMK